MGRKTFVTLTVIIVALLLSAALLLSNPSLFGSSAPRKTEPLPEAPVYVGVTYCGGNVTEAKMLIDKVKDYTNLFVVQSGTFLADVNATNAICSYAVESGLHVIVYFSAALNYRHHLTSFLSTADAWGSNLLGVYFDDEPGGKMLDSPHSIYFYDDAAKAVIEKSPRFLAVLKEDGTKTYYLLDGSVIDYAYFGTVRYQASENSSLADSSADYLVKPNGAVYTVKDNEIGAQVTDASVLEIIQSYPQIMAQKPFQTYDDTARVYLNTIQNSTGWYHSQTSIKAFTSDYALYWFDYKGGYDVVLAELGCNHTTAQDIALARGAAAVQGKEWGAIVTWKYSYPSTSPPPGMQYGPYLGSGEEIYSQLRQAYEAGAKYLVVFNYPTYPADNPYGVLQDEHFIALQRLWSDTVNNQTVVHGGVKAEAALVLPENYGRGMRFAEDKIWGIWKADDTTIAIWNKLQDALEKYGAELDIVYDEPAYPFNSKYQTIVHALE